MTLEQLQKLQKLTAISLNDEEKPVFTEYFTQMKEMFDKFNEEFKSDMILKCGLNTEKIRTFDGIKEQENFDTIKILKNVISERLVDGAILLEKD